MLKLKIICLGFLIGHNIFGQSSFEVEYGGDEEEKLIFTFETIVGDFISLGSKQSNNNSFPQSQLILKLNNSGEIINEMIYTKPDTNFTCQYGYEKTNGNYFLIGTLTDSVSTEDYNVTYVSERTPELNLVWEKFFVVPEPYLHHRISNFILDADSNLIIQGSADSSVEGYYDEVLLTMKFDKYGNQLGLNFYSGWESPSSYNEMIFNKDSTAINFFGIFTTSLSVLIEFIEMDLNLIITNYIGVIDWEHFSSDPITVKVLPDGNFVQANQASMEPGAYHDLYVKIMDEEFNTLRDTLMLYPEHVYIPVNEGMGFIDSNQIWVATFEPAFNYVPGTEVFRFQIFDSNLNLTGMKVFGGDRRYTFFNLTATSDGGCLMTGTVPDYNGSLNDNGYIIKVMPEDIITHAEETPIGNDRDVMVYPNPFTNKIRFQTNRKGLTYELYDVLGKKILSGKLDDHQESVIDTQGINAGIYFYNVRYDNLIILSGKLIKQ